MCKLHPLCFRVLIIAALAAALSPASRPGVKEDRQAVAQRIATEINSRQFKTIYVADFLDPVSGRIDKGCFFSSVFSTELTELKQGFKVINRIDAQRRLMELSSASAGQKVYSAKNLGLVMKADVLLTGKFEQQGASISLELSLVDLRGGQEIYHSTYREQSTDSFEALFPAARDSTGSIFYFANLDGVSQASCISCLRPASATLSDAKETQGETVLSVIFEDDGILDQPRILRGSDSSLIEVLTNWTTMPARDANGAWVPVRQELKVGPNSGPRTEVHRADVNGVSPPECIYCPPPVDWAQIAPNIQGTVLLEFLVTEHGEVSNVVVIKASADGLAKKAVETVQKWKFRPGTSKEGKAVAARIQTQVGFHRY